MISTLPFRSFDLLKKINVSISQCALLDELRLPSSIFSSSVDVQTKAQPWSSGVNHIGTGMLMDPHEAIPLGIIWALPSLFRLLTLDATPACHFLTSATLTYFFPIIFLHMEPSLVATWHLFLWQCCVYGHICYFLWNTAICSVGPNVDMIGNKAKWLQHAFEIKDIFKYFTPTHY